MKEIYKWAAYSLSCIALLFFWASCSSTSSVSEEEAFVNDLLSKMTLSEKIGQLNQYNGFYDITGPVPNEGAAKDKYQMVKDGRVGAMLNVRGVEEVRKMQTLAVEGSRLGIPMLFGFDVIHGYQTIFPIPLAEAASWDEEACYTSAKYAAMEATADGLNWTFAPMVDVSRDARWGRVMEGAGEDVFLGQKIAAARVRGFQGDDLRDTFSMAACAKHFAGYGFAESGKDYNTAEFSRATLHNVILPPFKSALESGVATFMNSFNDLDGVPATAHRYLQRDVLKDDWGFDGFVVSDWGSIAEMIDHGYAENGAEAARLALEAGSDMDMESNLYIHHLDSLVAGGHVSEDVIDDAVRRILTVKYRLGLFDDPYRYCSESRSARVKASTEAMDAALDVAKKSIVLLKNEGGLLPLKNEGLKIGLIGQLAADKNSPLGNWRLAATDHSAVSVLEGMQEFEGNSVRFAEGIPLFSGREHFIYDIAINETDRSGLTEAVALARNSDVVVMVLGEHGYQSGEGRSRSDLNLPGLQQEMLEAVHKVNKNIVLVLMNGRPLTLGWADEHIPSIVEAWHLGSQSGRAIAQVLYGLHNPSGKLPMCFPKHIGQVPIYYNHKSTGRPGPKEEVFWSRYIDGSNEPLYPFGYGLSYTQFEYSDLAIKKISDEAIEVSVVCKNSGDRAGTETVQLYLRDRFASVIRPVRELKGFKKIDLEAGSSQNVVFTLGRTELGFYTSEGKFVVESGTFDVMISNLKKTFELGGDMNNL